MIVDAHNHVLGAAAPPGHEIFRRQLLRHHDPSELPASGRTGHANHSESWLAPVDPDRLIQEHRDAGVDLSVVLAVAPSDYTEYGERGTVDIGRVTDVGGELSISKANDYIAALVRHRKELVGFAAVNPLYRGPEAARRELHRAITDLGLTGLKLYPMYDRYRFDSEDEAFPVLEAATALRVPVMVHMGTSPARDTALEYGNPISVDRAARTFRDLRIMICHAGFPWIDEALTVGRWRVVRRAKTARL